MDIVDRWLLPDGVEDVLPPGAVRLEAVRRGLLDLFATWGYEYVIPPMVEYLESLLTGTGHDLDLQTCKVVDLLTGRTMGVRADITPQVARIDAHSLNRDGVVRLCYAGTVVRAKTRRMLEGRTPLSVGAELFGDASGRADVEIVSLMVEALQSLGFDSIHLDLGDVAIFRQLVDSLALPADRKELLFDAVQKKAVAEINAHCGDFGLPDAETRLLTRLPGLMGGASTLQRAAELFAGYDGILASIENLRRVAAAVARRFDALDIYFDLSELRGYAYHTGIVFAARVDGSRQVVAKGGRYDHIGRFFGRANRSATGFSVDVRNIAGQAVVPSGARKSVRVSRNMRGPEPELWREMQALRQSGYIVLESGEAGDCDYELVCRDGEFVLEPGGESRGDG